MGWWKASKPVALKPHDAKPIIKALAGDVTVFINPIALKKMELFIELNDKEVGWLGTVERYETKDSTILFIRDVMLFEQQVHQTTCEITSEGLAKFGMEISAQPGGEEIYNSIRFWCHSHVWMGTSPSGQDNDQMKLFQDATEWFLRGIGNKKGELTFTFYDFAHGIIVDDLPWREYTPLPEGLRESVQKEVDAKVRPFTYQYQPPRGNQNQEKALTTGRATGTGTVTDTGTDGKTCDTTKNATNNHGKPRYEKQLAYKYLEKNYPEMLGKTTEINNNVYQILILTEAGQIWQIFDPTAIEDIAMAQSRVQAVNIMNDEATKLLGVDCVFSTESEAFIMDFADKFFRAACKS